ncbi:hypothetical protein DLJ53_06975 [Acuticoccus sediminis]|uniref:PurR-regulated permease PerM n=1 Tax=Acuticoccus sediminis TaxID=2184697 RepID=A0A8B2P2L5_9HYPH|nr:AI-2E family transporter [Acuticoccus sediminis]RAI04184.1 hypothetical protein DLJ53_06975 [Acuticoccus sediminis]
MPEPDGIPAPPHADSLPGRERTAMTVAIRLAALAAFLALLGALLRPLLGIIMWSGILAVALYPIYAWLARHLGGRETLASGLVMLAALAAVFGPAAYLITSLVISLEHIAEAAASGTLSVPALPETVKDVPVLGPKVTALWESGTGGIERFANEYGTALIGPGKVLLHIIAGLAGSVIAFAIAVVVAGLLFKPAPKISHAVEEIARRIAGPRGTHFVATASAAVRSVARGVIGIALLQSLLVGVVLIAGEVPHAGLLAMAVLIVLLAQMSAGFVTVPIMVWVWFSHGTVYSIVVCTLLVVITALEIPLKPIALRQGLESPMAVTFAGLVGGTVTFGLPGLFIGPMVFAVAWELLAVWLASSPPDDGQPTA